MFTMNDLFEIAIKMEKNGQQTYLDAVEKTTRKELKNLLEWMAREEAAHEKWFMERKSRLNLGQEEINLREMVSTKALQEMMGENTLDLEEVQFEQISSVSELMEIFIGFEKDTILFYELLEMFIDNDTVKEGLESIIAEEKKHVEKMSVMMQSLKETPL